MIDISSITRQISALRAQTSPNSITPEGLGTILQKIANLIGSLSQVPEQESTDLVARVTQCESDSQTALQAARSAQTTADGNVIDSFTHSQDEDELSLSIKQHGHPAEQVVLPAASSTGAGIMTATDKSHLDTAYGKRVNLMNAPSSESTVTLTITFGDGTTKTVTFVGATAGTGGKAGLMTKEQADQLAALVAAGTAENVRDDAGYLKQQYAAPVILRNVSDETVDDLSVGDIFYDAGKLWQYGTTESTDMGAPSKKVIYYCLADQMLYRWTGNRFVQAVSISSGDVTVPTKLSDLINDMGFLTAHQPLKTINGQTITGTGNITIDGAAELKDASSHIKQSVATPVVLRNVTDAVPDVLNIGDIYYDSGVLWCYDTPDTHNLGAPSKNLVYFCIANNSFYRWTGASFTQITTSGGGGASEILALNGVSSNQDGTVVFTDTVGNTYTVNLNHTHENMAKLIVCEESDLPSTLDEDTIYGVNEDGEIAMLYVGGLPFYGGGGVAPGEPAITKPSGTTINLGENSGSGVSAQVKIQGRNLTGDLTVTVGTGLTISYGNTTGASSVTIPLADALVGAMVTIAYAGSGALDDGALSITGGGASAKTMTVVVTEQVVQLAAVKFTKQQFIQTAIQPGPNTKLEIDMQLSNLADTGGATGVNFFGCPSDASQTPSKMFYGNTGTYQDMMNNRSYDIYLWLENGWSQGGSVYALRMANTAFTARSILIMDMPNESGSFSGVSVTLPQKTTTMPQPMKFGSGGGGDTSIFALADITLYSIKHYESGVLAHEYLPQQRGGVVGLYDSVTDTFISSATGTPLVAIQNS